MKIKSTLKRMKIWPKNLSLLDLPFAFEIAGIYRRNAEGRGV